MISKSLKKSQHYHFINVSLVNRTEIILGKTLAQCLAWKALLWKFKYSCLPTVDIKNSNLHCIHISSIFQPTHKRGTVRMQSLANKNYALELTAFGSGAVVSAILVQWWGSPQENHLCEHSTSCAMYVSLKSRLMAHIFLYRILWTHPQLSFWILSSVLA